MAATPFPEASRATAAKLSKEESALLVGLKVGFSEGAKVGSKVGNTVEFFKIRAIRAGYLRTLHGVKAKKGNDTNM